MYQLKPMKPTSIRHQRGITLLESLVAIVVAALGILGILGVQMRTLTDTQTSVRRAQAIRLIEDLGERMKVNPNALADINVYTSGFSNEPTPGNCSSGCDHSQLAAYDLAIWKQTVKTTLPLGQASIFLAPGETRDSNRRQLGVIISWRENERGGTKTDDIDATKVRSADGTTFTAGTDADNVCPTDRTCHLQYIPVAARCAPYGSGSGTLAFYCS
jgi:type IV pilus assembly protein PilV